MSSASSKRSSAGSASDDPAPESFDELVAIHYGFIWRVLRGMGLSRDDAEDAAQEVFLIAARKQLDVAPGHARSFLYGTAMRVASNARRGLRRRREVTGVPDDRPLPDSAGPERATEVIRARELLSELLQEIPVKLRRVLILAELEQLEVQEIAALEQIPGGTAASRLRLARKRFRELLASAQPRNPFGSMP